MKTELVYFISFDMGPVKIGRAIDIRKRLAALQTSHPRKLGVGLFWLVAEWLSAGSSRGIAKAG